MLKFIQINGFSSLRNFYLEPKKVNCFIGLNGAGQQTILDFFDFLQCLTTYERLERYQEEGIRYTDSRTRKIEFQIGFNNVIWEGVYDTSLMHCTYEMITDGNDTAETIDKQATLNGKPIRLAKLVGSILPHLNVPSFQDLIDFIYSQRENRNVHDRTQSRARLITINNPTEDMNHMLVEDMVNRLKLSRGQFFIATHDTIFLNYLQKYCGVEGIFYTYLDASAYTKSILFNTLPEIAEKMTSTAKIGNVYAETNLFLLEESFYKKEMVVADFEEEEDDE